MSYVPSFKSGDWKCECMVCGCVFKASEIRKRWDGMLVCARDYETKHPQLSVTGKKDQVSVLFSVPDPELSLVVDTGTYVSYYNLTDTSYSGAAYVNELGQAYPPSDNLYMI